MQNLTVDAEGRVTIPPEILKKRGLRPGDQVSLIEAAEGLLLCQGGVDSLTLAWWNGLSEEERRQAREEARRYEALSEEERDELWREEEVSIEEDAEGDEIELPSPKSSA